MYRMLFCGIERKLENSRFHAFLRSFEHIVHICGSYSKPSLGL